MLLAIAPLLIVVFLCVLMALVIIASLPRHPTMPNRVLVINLDRNSNRLLSFMDSYRSSDMPPEVQVERLSALDGNTVDWSSYLAPEALEQLIRTEKSGFREGHPDLTAGAVGCYLSHVDAWTKIAQGKAGYGLVFEDDAALAPDTWKRFTEARRQAPSGWDILLLGYEGEGRPVSSSVWIMSRFLRLHAYAISTEAAKRLCGAVMPIRQQIDWELNQQAKKGVVTVYAVHPQVVNVKWQGTDIQTPLMK